MKRSNLLANLCAASLVASAGFLIAGPLTPPAGSVASSYKTLSEVEPRTAINAANTPGDADSMLRITWPGSYYLVANVDTIPGKMGIEIAADDVTIDLNGFRIGGYPGALAGIRATGTDRRNISIKNGSVWTMRGDGINLQGDDYSASGCRVENLSIRDCGGDGLRTGSEALVERVDASNNGGAGIWAGRGATLTSCTASDNGDAGISFSEGSTITNCSARFNAGTGISGASASSVRGCVSESNSGKGFYGGYGAVFSECAARENAEGGIYAGVQAVITSCTIHHNGSWGIMTSPACSIIGCAVRENASNGIVAYAGCLVKDNTCVFNGPGADDAANIYMMNGGNRVEGNLCASADRGIHAATGGNVIIRNTCTGNTVNWQIAAGNAVGPIIQTPGNAAAIVGNTFAGSLGSADPNANFTY